MDDIEVTYQEILRWEKEDFLFVDIRDQASVEYGKIPGAVHIPLEELSERVSELPKGKKPVLYCMKGLNSGKPALWLREQGYSSYHLKGGYFGYLVSAFEEEEKEDAGEKRKEKNKQIEKSIQKTFHKKLFSPFAKAINRYELVKPGDRIAVCMSGGKDSMLMAKLFQEIKRHDKFPFELVFLVMDPGYAPENRKRIEDNAKLMDIPITVFESNIFDAVYEIEKSPCYLCARMRRGYLYSHAKELGCNKIALGHHYDDVIETILMGMLYGGQVQTMMPKLHSTNFEGMELIRPLYLIREEDIKRWRDANDLHFLQCACRFTDTCSVSGDHGEDHSKRLEIKKLIAELKKKNPFVESNIFKSVENVNLSTVIAYKKDGVKHEFLEEYED
ncbi:MAG: ATPase [Lachnospiraceae bacterium]|nr:ATPase [Lachnospiraceae bacterium]